jgi:PiT family inorganic phosphate transporter
VFLTPLLLSPLLALLVTAVFYVAFRWGRRLLRVTEETCFCAGNEIVEIAPAMGESAMLVRVEQLSLHLGDTVTCQRRYQGQVLGVGAAALLDRLHYLSAGMVSFARGLNDTPKIAALLLLASPWGGFGSLVVVGIAIAVGGVLSARKVAETMSRKITSMNHGQGFTANLVTGLVVIGASRLGMPVSTTHVSCGSLFGIGSVTKQGRLGMIGKIVGAWVLTLPLAAGMGAACFHVIRSL